jgi:ribosomal protein S25
MNLCATQLTEREKKWSKKKQKKNIQKFQLCQSLMFNQVDKNI